MSKLLLFSLLLFCSAGFAEATNARLTPSPTEAAALPANPIGETPQGPSAAADVETNAAEQDHTCLRIHAFIFKTDDDRTPKLVRETTCMPASRTGTKKVNRNVQPKLIPATGGNSF